MAPTLTACRRPPPPSPPPQVLPLSSLADPNKLRRVQNEIDVNQLLHHAHVATFLGSFQDEHNVYLMQELCSECGSAGSSSSSSSMRQQLEAAAGGKIITAHSESTRVRHHHVPLGATVRFCPRNCIATLRAAHGVLQLVTRTGSSTGVAAGVPPAMA